MARRSRDQGPMAADPFNIGHAFIEYTNRLMSDPSKLIEAQTDLMRSYVELWERATRRFLGEEVEPMVEPPKGDRRFRDPAWSESALFDYIKQAYLLGANWMTEQARGVEGLSEKDAAKVDFYTRQFVDAMSPSNFLMTNPEVLRATVESGGENLVHGLENLLEDLERGEGELMISMVDQDAFEVGRNIATTPGKVVYQTDLIQLIMYEAQTEQVNRRPLLIVPPWINKFYILDLRPENSLIRWAVEQGHTVFIVSWRNPDGSMRDKGFPEYMKEGLLAPLDVIADITGEPDANVIGYCLGGTLLGTTLGYLKAKGEEKRIASATFLVAMLDFSEAGEIQDVFIDEAQIGHLEDQMDSKGYLGAEALHRTFNLLRSNDLIWSFVVNNYLLGKDPIPFDLLYWNSDSTNLPRAMHSFYLRNMYLENRLVQPGGITIDGVPIDLGKVTTPACFVATREDHICPWRTVYKSSRLLGGPTEFMLGGSGHIAGVVNPPSANKYMHWTGKPGAAEPHDWLDKAFEAPGSWWPEWAKWAHAHEGGKVPARKLPGPRSKYRPIEDAPGSYVKVRAM